MEIIGTKLIPSPRDLVWKALNDPDVLKACLPGCESVEKLSDTDFKVTIKTAIGPLRARFQGSLQMQEVNAPQSCVMQFEGQGGAVGFGKGSSKVNLIQTPEGTQLSYEAKAQVGGKLAQVGSRLIDSVAKKMTDDFFKAFERQLNPEQGKSAIQSTPSTQSSPAQESQTA
jgi:carbon monoxide dehydrogenase subunit G